MEALSLRFHRRAQLLAGVGVAFRLQLRPWGSGLEAVWEHGPEAGGAGARARGGRRCGEDGARTAGGVGEQEEREVTGGEGIRRKEKEGKKENGEGKV